MPQLLQSRFGSFGLCDLLKNRNCKTLIIETNIPEFYKEILLNYQRTFPQVVDNGVAARRQILWHNDDIKINGRPFLIRQMYGAEVRLVDDLLCSNRMFMNFTQIKEKKSTISHTLLAVSRFN